MSANWHYLQDGKTMGPISEEQLRGMITSGALRPIDLVWREGQGDWAAIQSIPEFAGLGSGVPPKTPPQLPQAPFPQPSQPPIMSTSSKPPAAKPNKSSKMKYIISTSVLLIVIIGGYGYTWINHKPLIFELLCKMNHSDENSFEYGKALYESSNLQERVKGLSEISTTLWIRTTKQATAEKFENFLIEAAEKGDALAQVKLINHYTRLNKPDVNKAIIWADRVLKIRSKAEEFGTSQDEIDILCATVQRRKDEQREAIEAENRDKRDEAARKFRASGNSFNLRVLYGIFYGTRPEDKVMSSLYASGSYGTGAGLDISAILNAYEALHGTGNRYEPPSY